MIGKLLSIRNFLLTIGCVMLWTAVFVTLLNQGDLDQYQRWGWAAVLTTLMLITLMRELRFRKLDRYEAHMVETAPWVVGSMQLGCGDLFQCWFNGKGWCQC